ncbi:Sucrase/ferredoxin-like-domain-containing protein [Amylocystis lapponica]|nr:Sucrase/ferredoxin-like-domain-containing protein [Amylocystis lapponica]
MSLKVLYKLPFAHLQRTRCSRSFAATAAHSSSLAGTVPHHQSYILLHTHRPPAEYPSKPKSPLQRALLLKTAQWGGIVNFSWSEDQPVHPGFTGLGAESGEPEKYSATLFSANGGQLGLPEVSLANLDAVERQLREYALRPREQERPARLHLYVCTHGERDCRCGETGGEVHRALRAEVAKRGIGHRVMVGHVGHVGGHKYAGNLLVFPFGDWLGTLQDFHVSRVLDEILKRHDREAPPATHTEAPPLCPPFWRGRMGLDKEEQLALLAAPSL